MTSITDFKPAATTLAPAALAVLAIIMGLFMPFVGLPIAMVAVVAIAAANITNRRILVATIGAVALSIVINLALVMMALPAGRQLVLGA